MAKWLNVVLSGAYSIDVYMDGVIVDPSAVSATLTVSSGQISLTTPGDIARQWDIVVNPTFLSSPTKFRFTGFDLTTELDSAFAIVGSGLTPVVATPLTIGPPTLPDPATFTVFAPAAALQVTEDAGITGPGTYSFTLEYDAEVQDVFPIRGTLRAYRCATTPMAVYVRTEEGPMDLSSVTELEAIVVEGEWGWWSGWWDYQNCTPWGIDVRIPAYSPEPGRVQFTIDRANTRQRLWGSSHTLFVRADNRTIYSALLEIVG